MAIVYLNGEFIAEQDAKISVFDRGFLFGDSIYDVITVYKHHFIALDQHLQRLKNSLQAIEINLPMSLTALKALLVQLIKRNAYEEDELTLYVQISRGTQMPRSYLFNTQSQATIFISCSPTKRKSDEVLKNGLSAITLADKRRQECHIKSTSLLPSVIAANQAKKAGVDEALLIYQGKALESSSGNLFIVTTTGKIVTPPLQPHILAGVTRELILQLTREAGFSTQESDISVDDLMNAKEVWVTGSIKGVCPIVTINGQAVGKQTSGEIWEHTYRLYQDYKENLSCHQEAF